MKRPEYFSFGHNAARKSFKNLPRYIRLLLRFRVPSDAGAAFLFRVAAIKEGGDEGERRGMKHPWSRPSFLFTLITPGEVFYLGHERRKKLA